LAVPLPTPPSPCRPSSTPLVLILLSGAIGSPSFRSIVHRPPLLDFRGYTAPTFHQTLLPCEPFVFFFCYTPEVNAPAVIFFCLFSLSPLFRLFSSLLNTRCFSPPQRCESLVSWRHPLLTSLLPLLPKSFTSV